MGSWLLSQITSPPSSSWITRGRSDSVYGEGQKSVPEPSAVLFGFAVFLAYLYAFVGGFTDAANAIATSVGTRVLSPSAAVGMAGFFNLLGGLTGTAVAVTIGKGLVDPSGLSLTTVIAGLAGAMSWSLFTYRLGIPVSETHGLVGGILGAGIATAGFEIIQVQSLTKVLIAIVASPLIGFVGGLAMIVVVYWLCHRFARRKAIPMFRNLQRLSAAYMAFSHGRNDAQTPMGVLALALSIHFGWDELTIPLWVVLSCSALASVGTAYGGWRIIRTLGMKMTALDSVQGFAAETAGATVLELASGFGIPVSTTHTITSSIIGVGVTRSLNSVRWALAVEIVVSWILTLPATMIVGGCCMLLLRRLLG